MLWTREVDPENSWAEGLGKEQGLDGCCGQKEKESEIAWSGALAGGFDGGWKWG